MTDKAASMMADNINQVWNERNPEARLKAIEKLYSETASLNHVGDQFTGFEGINNSVTAVQKNMPPDFEFTLLKPVIINNSIGRAIWGAGPKGQPPVGTGMDIAHFENGKIKSLYVFLDN